MSWHAISQEVGHVMLHHETSNQIHLYFKAAASILMRSSAIFNGWGYLATLAVAPCTAVTTSANTTSLRIVANER